MNELILVSNDSTPTADLDMKMVDWYVSNMPPNTSRAYKNVDDKHRTETTNVL
jgi:hypothetical protein